MKSLLLIFLPIIFFKAATDCNRELKEPPHNYREYFNKAVCLSFVKKSDNDDVLKALHQAAELGYRDFTFIQESKQFENILDEKNKVLLIKKVKKNHREFLSNGQVNPEIDHLYHEDQVNRYRGSFSYYDDKERVVKVLDMHRNGMLKTAYDFHFSSVILIHGNESSDFELANKLSIEALKLDPSLLEARFIICASEDRFLRSLDKPQIWGTQSRWNGKEWSKEPFDKKTKTAKERESCWG